MNTLNNQQINPGNRVDFSRIRRFSKGGIPKFETSGKISNTFNTDADFWSNMNKDVINNWANIAGNQNFSLDDLNRFISTNRSLHRSSGYDGTSAVKHDGVKQYQQDFHNKYGFGNTDSFWNGMKTVDRTLGTGDSRQQEGQQFAGDDYFGTQTDYRRANYFSNDELAKANEAVKSRGWQFVVDDAQNEGHTVGEDGRQFYKLQEIPQATNNTETTTTASTETQSDPGTDTTTQESTNSYKPLEFIPEYQKSKWTGWEHLPGILANNLITNRRNYKTALQQKVPLPTAPYKHAVVTNDYIGRSIMQQQINEARARNTEMARNTSDLDSSMQAQQQFESQVAMPAEMQMAQRKSDEFNRTTQNVVNVANENQANATAYQNQRDSNLKGLHNALLNEKQKYNSTKANEINSFMQNMATSRRQYDLQEAYNRDLYNQNVNNFLTLQEQGRAYAQYQNALKDGWKSGTGYEDFYNYLMSGGEPRVMQNKEWMDTLTNHKYDLSKIRPIIESIAAVNPHAKQWLSNYDNYQSSQKLAYENAYREAARRSAFAGLFQKQYYSGSNDPALQKNLSTLYPGYGGYYKKGGKVEDRFIKYVENNRKLLKDMNDSVNKTQAQADKKLLRDLDALDKETLLLLRSIFK